MYLASRRVCNAVPDGLVLGIARLLLMLLLLMLMLLLLVRAVRDRERVERVLCSGSTGLETLVPSLYATWQRLRRHVYTHELLLPQAAAQEEPQGGGAAAGPSATSSHSHSNSSSQKKTLLVTDVRCKRHLVPPHHVEQPERIDLAAHACDKLT
jgi:hypothetical protein